MALGKRGKLKPNATLFCFLARVASGPIRVRFPRTRKSSLKTGGSVNILNLSFVNKVLQLLFVNHDANYVKNATKAPNHSILLKIYIHDG